ncbi:MAG: hypothetical protein ABGW77_05420 [Campylobacterales bacterium]
MVKKGSSSRVAENFLQRGIPLLLLPFLLVGMEKGETERRVLRESFRRLETLCQKHLFSRFQCQKIKGEFLKIYLKTWTPSSPPIWCNQFPSFCIHFLPNKGGLEKGKKNPSTTPIEVPLKKGIKIPFPPLQRN